NIAFVGRSGSGKSTVMKLLCGFYYPQKGSYRIYGHDFHEWNLQALRSNIGLVSQNVFLFPGTVAENISYGKPGASREEIIDACRKAGAHDFIMRLPMGYETEVGERGAKLSGGQKQRLSIARAFLKDAPILLLDEPTSAVDVETEAGIQEALRKILENRTVITIAHRLSTIEDADEIYEFDNGEIVRHTIRKEGI
ncbi:MAG: ATP-binding cassette domain-containing protein, partial [Acetatifactor sp.]|nr:ATP-binding cassette domain-containing protein [Acetatifactor sp.]